MLLFWRWLISLGVFFRQSWLSNIGLDFSHWLMSDYYKVVRFVNCFKWQLGCDMGMIDTCTLLYMFFIIVSLLSLIIILWMNDFWIIRIIYTSILHVTDRRPLFSLLIANGSIILPQKCVCMCGYEMKDYRNIWFHFSRYCWASSLWYNCRNMECMTLKCQIVLQPVRYFVICNNIISWQN